MEKRLQIPGGEARRKVVYGQLRKEIGPTLRRLYEFKAVKLLRTRLALTPLLVVDGTYREVAQESSVVLRRCHVLLRPAHRDRPAAYWV